MGGFQSICLILRCLLGGFGGLGCIEIMIWAPIVPFLEPLKWPKRGDPIILGITKMALCCIATQQPLPPPSHGAGPRGGHFPNFPKGCHAASTRERSNARRQICVAPPPEIDGIY